MRHEGECEEGYMIKNKRKELRSFCLFLELLINKEK
jgi:hypothetical protein